MENIKTTISTGLNKTYTFTGQQILMTLLVVFFVLCMLACLGRHHRMGRGYGDYGRDNIMQGRHQMMRYYDRQDMRGQGQGMMNNNQPNPYPQQVQPQQPMIDTTTPAAL